ncbi:MAG: Smr/MutS family protein [Caulobacteraceae bacterium]|nr:Smr/MutS family protein [Caulobacteraceae bacterium]
MKLRPRLEDDRVWAVVAATVRPLPGRAAPMPKAADGPLSAVAPVARRKSPPEPAPARPTPVGPPEPIEPGRHRRLVLEREALAGYIDLHGLDQGRARAALTAFVRRGHGEGRRVILVITGKGVGGDGVLRRRVPEWLAESPLRALVAAVSPADRRHGGEGALYVALKRRKGA